MINNILNGALLIQSNNYYNFVFKQILIRFVKWTRYSLILYNSTYIVVNAFVYVLCILDNTITATRH